MTEPRRIFVGVLPTGQAETFSDGADALSIMLNDAIRAADAERAEAERQRRRWPRMSRGRGTRDRRERVADFRRRWRYVGSVEARRPAGDRARQRLWRLIHTEGARNAEGVAAAEARVALKREKVTAPVARLQRLIDLLHAGLVEERLDALRHSEQRRADLVDLQIDAVFRDANAVARQLEENSR